MKKSNLHDILYSLKPLKIEAGDDYIEKHENEGPSRELCNVFGNVITVLPSGKNGQTRRSESLGEYQCQLFLEYHPLVVGYLEQPPTRMILRPYAKGERLTRYTPDVGVKLKNGVNLVIEYKPSGAIHDDLKKEHPRFSVGEDGRFRDPKAEAHFRELGIHFMVVTEIDFGPEFFRNMSLLCSYYQSERPAGVLVRLVEGAIGKVGVSTLERLVLSVEENVVTDAKGGQGEFGREQMIECVYWMLIHGSLYGSLHDSSVQDLAQFEIYSSRALARCRQRLGVYPVAASVQSSEFRLDEDSVINFAQKTYRYVGIDSNLVYLRSDSGKIETFDRDDLEKFFHDGSLHCQCESKPEELTPFARSDNERRDAAIKRAEAMALHEEGVTRLPKSTYYKLRGLKKFGEDTYGCGLSGLLPEVRPGNTAVKTCNDSKDLAKEYIRVSYLGLKQDPGSRWELPVSVSRENRHKKLAWGQYVRVAKSYGLTPISYPTFTRAINRVRELKKTLAKEGRKAAYQISDMTSGDWSGLTHGLFAGHIVEIDHTVIDLEAIDEDDGVGLGRLWLTVAIDTYSRAILGWYIGFGAPSRVAVMMVVRDMVRRTGMMPLCISVDGGKEFRSVYFDSLLAFYRVHKRERPPSLPRYGAEIESLFGTINKDTWHNLLGSTKLMVNVRQVTKEFIAKNRAVWGVREVKEMFGAYVVNYNEKLLHTAIGATPMSFHQESYSNLLPKQRRVVRFDEAFEIQSMLAPDRREKLTCRRGSLQINNGWYTHPVLKEEVNKGKKFIVKWSPWDLRYIYFAHKGNWHKALLGGCHFKQSMSGAEVEILSNEVKARSVGDDKRNTLRIFQQVEFLEKYKGMEEDLTKRKTRLDREAALGDEVDAYDTDEEMIETVAAQFHYTDAELPDEPIHSDILDD